MTNSLYVVLAVCAVGGPGSSPYHSTQPTYVPVAQPVIVRTEVVPAQPAPPVVQTPTVERVQPVAPQAAPASPFYSTPRQTTPARILRPGVLAPRAFARPLPAACCPPVVVTGTSCCEPTPGIIPNAVPDQPPVVPQAIPVVETEPVGETGEQHRANYQGRPADAVTDEAANLRVAKKYENKVGHEQDYSWITGHLFYVHADGGRWVVRYALPDQVDKFGGSVVLAPGVEMRNFREGDLVCIHGQVLSEQRTSRSLGGALYRVDSITMVERSDP